MEQSKPKGSQCSINGSQYEKKIYSITKHCNINNEPFNTQKEEELAGSSCKNDIECNFIGEKNIGIEAKKYNTPDWMQCSIKYNKKVFIHALNAVASAIPISRIYFINIRLT